jgi:hypothetical protein
VSPAGRPNHKLATTRAPGQRLNEDLLSSATLAARFRTVVRSCVSAKYGPPRGLYLILVNFPISVAVPKEFCAAARLNASKLAPGCRPSLSVLRAYSVNS